MTKQLTLLSALFWLASLGSLHAQSLPSVSLPEYPNRVSTTLPSNGAMPKGTAPSTRASNALNAKQIMFKTQEAADAKHGAPNYPAGASAEQIQAINKAYHQQQLQQQAGYANNNKTNDFNGKSLQQQVHYEMMNLLRESQLNHRKMEKEDHSNSPAYQDDLPNYLSAKNHIKRMLNGAQTLSIKDAYYHAEAAYGNLHLSHEEYNALIEKNKSYILKWLSQNQYDTKNPEALHYGIQQFMTDTLWVELQDPDEILGSAKRVAHYPFYYDYIDYSSTDDRRNYFVSKTLATGSGQCHTLPITYLVLAEALGVKAHLSYNPDHSFIRYQNNAGQWLNYETTLGRFVPDQMYFDMLPTMAKAHQNGLYVDALSDQQLLATILIDLSVNFITEHWFSDGEIVHDCLETAEQYFPKQNFINTPAYRLKKKILTQRFDQLVREKKIKDFEGIQKDAEVKAAHQKLKNYLTVAKEMGLEEFPEAEYMRMIAFHDKEARLQIAKKIDTKTKKDLFSTH